MTSNYPCLKDFNVFELAKLLKAAKECNDNEFREAILKEFKERDKNEIR